MKNNKIEEIRIELYTWAKRNLEPGEEYDIFLQAVDTFSGRLELLELKEKRGKQDEK